jgi:hypothetical protein
MTTKAERREKKHLSDEEREAIYTHDGRAVSGTLELWARDARPVLKRIETLIPDALREDFEDLLGYIRALEIEVCAANAFDDEGNEALDGDDDAAREARAIMKVVDAN